MKIYIEKKAEAVGQYFNDDLQLKVSLWFNRNENGLKNAEIVSIEEHDKEVIENYKREQRNKLASKMVDLNEVLKGQTSLFKE